MSLDTSKESNKLDVFKCKLNSISAYKVIDTKIEKKDKEENDISNHEINCILNLVKKDKNKQKKPD